MKVVKLTDEQEVKIIDKWNELTLGKYIQLVNLMQNQEKYTNSEFSLRCLEKVTSLSYEEILELYNEDYDILANELFCQGSFLHTEIKEEKATNWIFNEIDYSVVFPERIRLGEKQSLDILDKDAKSTYDQWLNILSIFVRPAIKTKNEFGEDIYNIEKFNADMDSINKRKELIYNNMPAVNAIWICNFFANGKIR